MADGSGSWEAYVLNGNLFLKRFADVPASAQPTGEGEIDVYPGAGFLEFEEQGPYTMIAAAGSLTFAVEWKAVKVPTSISVSGLARRLWYQSGLSGAPPFEPKITYRSPSRR